MRFSPAVRHETGTIEGVGGLSLFRQAWLPAGEPRAVVVLAHGASEHSSRYAWVAGRLAARGLAVHALDHRGHGRSEGRRAYVDRLEHAVRDLDALVDLAAARHPGAPVFLLGHSFGGCLALSYALRDASKLRGLALSAPLAALDAAPLPVRAAAHALSVCLPQLGVYRVDASAVSTDPEVVRDYEDDPLNHHGPIPARTVHEIASAVGRFPSEIGSLSLPLLVMHSPDDRITLFSGSEMVFEGAGSADKTLERYDGLAHELLNEPERERVLADLADWIDARL